MKKLIAVPAWMCGYELKECEVTVNSDGSGFYEYATHIGWMAKPTVKRVEFDSYDQFVKLNNLKCICNRASKFLSKDEIREFNMKCHKVSLDNMKKLTKLKNEVMSIVRNKFKSHTLPLPQVYNYSFTWRNIKAK